jgi:magnesium transporter
VAATQLQQQTTAILRRLLRKDAAPAVRKVLARARPADIAAAMDLMTSSERRRLYSLLTDRDRAADVMAYLDDDAQRDLAVDMTQEQVADLLDRMAPDDATDVVENLPDALRERIMNNLDDDSVELRELLAWPSDTAGGLMSPAAFTIPETCTCGQAIIRLQEMAEDLDSVFYLYLVDSRDRLSGVVSLRMLLIHPPSTPLVSVMTDDIISVNPERDQEEVARVVARYDLLAVPVVGTAGELLGIITVDDVLDVVQEEAVEDMLLMAGVGEDADGPNRSVFRLAQLRFGWLIATAIGGMLADRIYHWYGAYIPIEVVGGLVPVIMGMGGNVGIQSGTLAIRGIATGRVHMKGGAGFVWREARVGLILGIGYGILLGLYGLLLGSGAMPLVGLTVGISVCLAIILGSVLGSSLPILLHRLGADPAIATGPFVTTGVDILGIVSYFSVARVLLGSG